LDHILTKDNIRILANVVIANPTRTNLLPQSCTTQGFVASNAIQAKKMNYYNQHPTNQFLPLVIEIFDCSHKHVDLFLHDYANVIWSLKGLKGPRLSTLVTFFRQKASITLQMMQASFILSWVITIGLATSQLSPIQNRPPITTTDLL
jgi:hypothetical protein